MEMAYQPSSKAPPHLGQVPTILPGGRGGLGKARSLSHGKFDLGLNPSLILAPAGFSRL